MNKALIVLYEGERGPNVDHLGGEGVVLLKSDTHLIIEETVYGALLYVKKDDSESILKCLADYNPCVLQKPLEIYDEADIEVIQVGTGVDGLRSTLAIEKVVGEFCYYNGGEKTVRSETLL